MEGDFSGLPLADRLRYYRTVCQSLGLNPLTRPFAFITLHDRLTLYAKRDATDQLRRIRGVTVQIVSREFVQALGLYVVTARATDAGGRCDESVGAVSVRGLSGDALANAIMTAETKAKRRVTLSLCGLGWLDESEVVSVSGARTEDADAESLPGTEVTSTDEGKGPIATTECSGGSVAIGLDAAGADGGASEIKLPDGSSSTGGAADGMIGEGAVGSTASQPRSEEVCRAPGCGRALTRGQRVVSIRMFGQPLCPACQRREVKEGMQTTNSHGKE